MKNVVLVDDSVILVELEQDFIECYNDAKCKKFYNPQTALKYIRTNSSIDILITDYEMQQMNGIELAQKAFEENPKMRVIVYSNYDEKFMKEICKQYVLEGKIEFRSKSNIDYLMTLTGKRIRV